MGRAENGSWVGGARITEVGAVVFGEEGIVQVDSAVAGEAKLG